MYSIPSHGQKYYLNDVVIVSQSGILMILNMMKISQAKRILIQITFHDQNCLVCIMIL